MITIKGSVAILVAYLTSRPRGGLRIICGGLWRKVIETSPVTVEIVEISASSSPSLVVKSASSASSIGLRLRIELNHRSVTCSTFRALSHHCQV